MLSVEELLRPRYKAIADYPFSPFKNEQVLILDTLDDRYHLEAEWYGLIEGNCYYESYLNRWPHLFKKLEWWEDRKESDMPEYIICKTTGFVFSRNTDTYTYYGFLPATKEQYESQK